MDIKMWMLYTFDSPVRSIVHDVSEELYELTLRGPRGQEYSFSYAGTPVVREALRAGSLAVVPGDLEPALRKQILHLPTYSPTRHVQRCVNLASWIFLFFFYVVCVRTGEEQDRRPWRSAG
jgi:hypothetical protein